MRPTQTIAQDKQLNSMLKTTLEEWHVVQRYRLACHMMSYYACLLSCRGAIRCRRSSRPWIHQMKHLNFAVAMSEVPLHDFYGMTCKSLWEPISGPGCQISPTLESTLDILENHGLRFPKPIRRREAICPVPPQYLLLKEHCFRLQQIATPIRKRSLTATATAQQQ